MMYVLCMYFIYFIYNLYPDDSDDSTARSEKDNEVQVGVGIFLFVQCFSFSQREAMQAYTSLLIINRHKQFFMQLIFMYTICLIVIFLTFPLEQGSNYFYTFR